jgi:hypothetical protein
MTKLLLVFSEKIAFFFDNCMGRTELKNLVQALTCSLGTVLFRGLESTQLHQLLDNIKA